MGQGYWESRRVEGAHTRDTGGKDKKICRSTSAVIIPPVFAPRVADQNINYIKISVGPIGGLVEFHNFSHFGTPLRSHAGTSPRASCAQMCRCVYKTGL
jgi:hypothetical protein